MKKIALAAGALLCFGLSGTAFAQTCTGFSGTISSAVSNQAGNSCQASSTLAQACTNGEFLNGAGVAIYQVTVGAGANFTISVNSTTFIPWIGFIANTCSSNTACSVDLTRANPGTITSPALTPAAGTYYLIVGDVSADAPGCGDFSLTMGPTLPVELQSFSVN